MLFLLTNFASSSFLVGVLMMIIVPPLAFITLKLKLINKIQMYMILRIKLFIASLFILAGLFALSFIAIIS